MRLFVAIFLPHSVLDHLEHHLHQASGLPGIKWVNTQSLHVTLKFFGEVEEARIPSIIAALDELAVRHSVFSLRCEKAGVFPDPSQARVFWIGLEGEVGTLLQLQGDTEVALEPLGFLAEHRPFQPHLTVARAASFHRSSYPRKAKESKAEIKRSADQFCRLFETYSSSMFDVTALHLVKSTLTPYGSRYETIHTAPLSIHP